MKVAKVREPAKKIYLDNLLSQNISAAKNGRPVCPGKNKTSAEPKPKTVSKRLAGMTKCGSNAPRWVRLIKIDRMTINRAKALRPNGIFFGWWIPCMIAKTIKIIEKAIIGTSTSYTRKL